MALRGGGAAGLVIGLCVAAGLAGCTAEGPAASGAITSGATTSSPSDEVDAPSFADQFAYLPTAGATLATATLAGSGSCPPGPVSIVVSSALELEVHTPGASSAGGDVTFRLTPARTGTDSGLPVSIVPDEQLGVGVGHRARTAPDGESIFLLPRESRADRGDLTYFHSIRCLGPDGDVLDQAPLTWTQPPYFSDIHPVDSGSRPNARGTVRVAANTPALYVIATDDTLEAIASRFGIRPVELLYINPSLGYTAPQLLSGDALNLDPRIR